MMWINGLIKDCKVENCYYSKEAEATYKADLEKKVAYIFRNYEDQKDIVEELFPVFIEQLKKYEYKIINYGKEKRCKTINYWCRWKV